MVKSNEIEMMRDMVNARLKERSQHNTDRNGSSRSAINDICQILEDNEVGDATLFASLVQNKFCYDHSEKNWYKFNGNSWEIDSTEEIMGMFQRLVKLYRSEAANGSQIRLNAVQSREKIKERECIELEKQIVRRIMHVQTVSRQRNILTLAASGTGTLGISGEEWDRDPLLLGCFNGVIDLRNGELRPGRPVDYIRTYSPTIWKGLDEPAPLWKDFLLSILGNSFDLYDYIQRLLGYSISGLSEERVLPVLYGQGWNGKGTILEVMSHVLGPLATPIQSETLLDQKLTKSSSAPSPEIIALRGKRLVWASETNEGRAFNAGKAKWLVGGDKLTARPLYSRCNITFLPTHTLFLLTNYRPHVSAEDYAFWKRLHLIPFKFSFVDDPQEPNERKRDPKLLEKLKIESSGILAWLVKGFMNWDNDGLNPPNEVLNATQSYRSEEDILGHFIADFCVEDEHAEVQARVIYDAYRRWCDENGHKPYSSTKFGINLSKKYEKKTGNVIKYLGIRIK